MEKSHLAQLALAALALAALPIEAQALDDIGETSEVILAVAGCPTPPPAYGTSNTYYQNRYPSRPVNNYNYAPSYGYNETGINYYSNEPYGYTVQQNNQFNQAPGRVNYEMRNDSSGAPVYGSDYNNPNSEYNNANIYNNPNR